MPDTDRFGWMPGPGTTQQFGSGIGRELLANRIAEEVPQEYVEAVEGTGALADEVLASFAEQPQDLGVTFRSVLGLH
jgi:hypothetical protein